PQAAAVRHRDSLPLMTSYGISKLISDSGVVRYKIMTEEWRFFDRTHPPRNEFLKGIFLQRYDAKFNVDLYITADTAYWYDQKLWELRGRVRVRNLQDGTTYTSQQLYWDNEQHEFYSNVPMHIVTPDRDLQGDRFRSDEQLTRYEVRRTRGFIPMPSSMSSTNTTSSSTTADTTKSAQ
ncbi:MAG: LPS export ABC transporter periplasmic protein LptC, partial [Alloprevotella sp.]|nr:LPS export ABC transporter periplasmic protein LptC [Alloprevotella sp.]